MAKRVKKGVSFESLDIDLKKEVDLEAGKDAVNFVNKATTHSNPAPTTTPMATPAPEAVQKPAPAPAIKAKPRVETFQKEVKKVEEKKAAEIKEELIRTTIDFPKSEHRQLKILAMNEDMKLYQYLYGIIKRHMDSLD